MPGKDKDPSRDSISSREKKHEDIEKKRAKALRENLRRRRNSSPTEMIHQSSST